MYELSFRNWSNDQAIKLNFHSQDKRLKRRTLTLLIVIALWTDKTGNSSITPPTREETLCMAQLAQSFLMMMLTTVESKWLSKSENFSVKRSSPTSRLLVEKRFSLVTEVFYQWDLLSSRPCFSPTWKKTAQGLWTSRTLNRRLLHKLKFCT